MNTSSQCGDRVPVGESEWPRDFDFREAYAEQRELLEALPERATTLTTASGADRHE